MPSETPGIEFGPFRLDLAKRLLYREGKLVPLRPKVADVLIALAERKGDLVEKEELIQRIWGGAAVEESNLTTTIFALRKTLGEGYIQTVPRRGYQFVARLSETAPSRLQAGTQMDRRRIWAAAILTIAGAMVLVWRLAAPRNAPVEPAWITAPLTTLPGAEVFPAFSPDAKKIVFLWTGDSSGRPDLYEKARDGGGLNRLTNDDAVECYPAWSPDGKWIAFLHCSPGGIDGYIAATAPVHVVPAWGGEKRKVGEVRSSANRFLPQLAWTPDSQRLIVRNRESASDRIGLFLLSVATGELRQITFPPAASEDDSSPAISPDGSSLAFVRAASFEVRSVYVVPLAAGYSPNGQPRRLTATSEDIAGVFWVEGGRRIVYFSRGSVPHLWQVDALQGGAPHQLPQLSPYAAHVNASPDGRWFVHTDGYVDVDIWRIPLPPASVPAAVRLVSSTRGDLSPQFSPDGAKIVFASNRTGAMEIWISGSDGSSPVQLTHYGAECGSPRWSPDGSEIAFDATIQAKADIYVISSNGGEPRRLTNHGTDERVPTWSHDGKTIHFTSKRTGRQEIYKIPAAGGQETQVTRKGGFIGLESTDGTYLYYARRFGRPYSVYRLDLASGEEKRVIETIKGWQAFALVSGGIFFVPDEKPQSLLFYDFATERIRVLGDLAKGVGAGFAFSPANKSVLVAPAEFRNGDLFLVSR